MKKEIQLEVINKVRKIRQDNDISQAILAEILGLNSYGTIGNIESNKYTHKYTLNQLYTISNHFKYPFEKLFLSESERKLDKEQFTKILIKKIIDYDG